MGQALCVKMVRRVSAEQWALLAAERSFNGWREEAKYISFMPSSNSSPSIATIRSLGAAAGCVIAQAI